MIPEDVLEEMGDQSQSPLAESEESQFLIYLEFPDHGRPLLTYRVYAAMPVRLLYQAIANGILDCEDHQIRIFIGEECLLHSGTITDRCFPGLPDIPTVFLYEHCTARIARSFSNDTSQEGMLEDLIHATDKFEAALAVQPEAALPRTISNSGEKLQEPHQRRVSTRVRFPRNENSQTKVSTSRITTVRRPVGDRYFYEPVFPTNVEGSSDITGDIQTGITSVQDTMLLAVSRDDQDVLMLGPVIEDMERGDPPSAFLTKHEKRRLVRRFKTESRHKRRQFKHNLQREWESQVAPVYDQENDNPDGAPLMEEEIAYTDYMHERLVRFDQDNEDAKLIFWTICRMLPFLITRARSTCWKRYHRMNYCYDAQRNSGLACVGFILGKSRMSLIRTIINQGSGLDNLLWISRQRSRTSGHVFGRNGPLESQMI
jgi:hypothetical protein